MPKSCLSTNHVKFEEEEIHTLHLLKDKFILKIETKKSYLWSLVCL
jgi:hypothetical protein